MINRFDIGDEVAAVKALRNDGTYPEPGIATGAVLVPEGATGEVLNVGLYLQEHIVYAVAFGNGRVVGCLERELRPAGQREDLRGNLRGNLREGGVPS